MASEEPTPGRCNAIARSDGREGLHCEKWPAEGASRCRFHGGASSGPQDPSALEGNDHAVGNPGGGAPALNMNAAVAGAHSALDLLEERLDGREQERYEKLRASYIERADSHVPTAELEAKAREAALLAIRAGRSDLDVLSRDVCLERDVEHSAGTGPITRVNPALTSGTRDTQRRTDLLEALGVYPVAPESGAAELVEGSEGQGR